MGISITSKLNLVNRKSLLIKFKMYFYKELRTQLRKVLISRQKENTFQSLGYHLEITIMIDK